jgi:hypothetical protein
MAFTDDEIEQIKFWLGYGNLTTIAAPWFDVALVFADIVQDQTSDWGVTYVRDTILPTLTALDTSITSASQVAGIRELVGDVVFEPNTKHLNLLALQRSWVQKLSDVVMVPINNRRASSGGSVEVY